MRAAGTAGISVRASGHSVTVVYLSAAATNVCSGGSRRTEMATSVATSSNSRPSSPYTFSSAREEQYLFIDLGGAAKCLVCGKIVQTIRKYNLQRHYATHSSEYKGVERDMLIERLKNTMATDNDADHKISESAVRLSYKISLEIAKQLRPFKDGKFAKICLCMMADEVFPERIPECESISLSSSSVMRRIADLANNVEEQLVERCKSFICYSLALDESQDTCDTAQLVIFVRGVDVNLQITEEMLDLVPMMGTTTGADIFRCVEALNRLQLPWNKLISIATDGAPAMIGGRLGLIGRVRDRIKDLGTNQNIVSVHCIIHQENLCAKRIKLNNVMRVVVKTTNFIRSKGLRHRQFKVFLDECNSEFGDLPYYCEVRWLRRGALLERYCELREEIALFLEEKGMPVPELSDSKWICDLAFLADLTGYLNILNRSLQGKGQIITQLIDSVLAFKCKLALWEQQLINKNTSHFPKLSSASQHLEFAAFEQYASVLNDLHGEFGVRFQELETMESTYFPLFVTPFTVDVENVPTEFQLELIDLQYDREMKDFFVHKRNLTDFYINFPQSRFPRLHRQAAHILSMFGSTYLCEQFFSLMKHCKPGHRSQLSDNNLKCSLRLCTTKTITPNIEKIIRGKRIQKARRLNQN